MANKMIHIIGGGTISHVRNHLALAAPAYGATARRLDDLCRYSQRPRTLDVACHLTRMAGGDTIETHNDLAHLVDRLVADPATKIIFMTAAVVDWTGVVDGVLGTKDAERLRSRSVPAPQIQLLSVPKILPRIRERRKDIFLIGFKTTTNYSEDEQYLAGLMLLKESSCNLVLANDVVTRVNMIVTPEESRYSVTKDRDLVLRHLVDMALMRSQLTFTRSTVVGGEPVPWSSELVPNALRAVVDYCIERGAYKPFRGATVGHFACKLDDRTFLTSIRKSNFNDLDKLGLVKIETDGPDSVIAYGAKPSVGGQSQRIVFHDHVDYDCIVHFHCPRRPDSPVPIVPQRAYECGSHECGRNTSRGLQRFGNLSAVYLDEHGPNIVFHHSIEPREVIDFIDANFDLAGKTGGYVELGPIFKERPCSKD